MLMDKTLNRYAESWIEVPKLGARIVDYQPTFPLEGRFINERHRFYTTCPRKGGLIDVGIEGWLWPEDALKLYELGYFVTGDILELGCFRGLSTSILSQANHDSGLLKRFQSVDLDPRGVVAAQDNLRQRDLAKNAEVLVREAATYCRELAGERRKFDLVFVDHSHAYEAVLEVCRELETVVSPGGFCLFHDYNDSRNIDPAETDYGVSQAVADGLSQNVFEFYGIFGCCALFRAR